MKRKFVISLLAAAMFATSDPWSTRDLMQPADLVAMKSQPAIFYVGFPVLYRAAHIPGAVLAGPCSKSEGLDLLTKALGPLPRPREIVLYCGCCPFQKCPNIRPAYQAAADLGFSRVRVLVIETNLHTDWVAKGYPVARR
jgi:rhodanese-related sulfurtransferase